MKHRDIPPAGLVIAICLALISPALAVVNSITVKAGVAIGSDASNINHVTASGLSIKSGFAPPQLERSSDTTQKRTEETQDSTRVSDDSLVMDGNPIGYRLARVPGDSPLLFFFITIVGAMIRKTRFPGVLRCSR